jgi:hypothetical protein
MNIEELKEIKHDKIKNVLELKEEKISKDKAHLVFEPSKKDHEFNIDIDVELKETDKGIEAESRLIVLNAKTKRLLKKFMLSGKILRSSLDLKEYLEYLADIFEKFKLKNLNSIFDRDNFKTVLGTKNKKEILKKVVAKLKLK